MAFFLGISAAFRYLRLKFLVSFIRLTISAISILKKVPRANPDHVELLPSRDAHRSIKANVYLPDGDAAGPRPALINFCGSGLALHSHGTDDEFCRHIAQTTTHVVLDVQYRVGPEDPFPAAVHDVEDVIKHVQASPEKYDTSRISVSGFSSGGTLALVAPMLVPKGSLQAIIAFYPATDLAANPDSRRPPAPDAKPRSTFWTKIFRQGYIGQMDPRDPRISPAYADADLYPDRMMIVTGDHDSSALEAEDLAERINNGRAAASHVMVSRKKGCGHAFDKMARKEHAVTAKTESYQAAAEMLREVANASH